MTAVAMEAWVPVEQEPLVVVYDVRRWRRARRPRGLACARTTGALVRQTSGPNRLASVVPLAGVMRRAKLRRLGRRLGMVGFGAAWACGIGAVVWAMVAAATVQPVMSFMI